MTESDDNPLRRWSRRKREQAREETRAAEAPGELAGPSAPEADGDPDPDPDLVARLPDIDSLTLDSDFTAFLQPGVPAALRNRALARLWRMDPVFANLDGLNNYAEDYRAQMLATAGTKIASLFRVGRGMISAEEALAELAGESGAEPAPREAVPAVEDEAAGPESDSALAERGQATDASADQPEIVDNSGEKATSALAASLASDRPRLAGPENPPKAAPGAAVTRRWGRFS